MRGKRSIPVKQFGVWLADRVGRRPRVGLTDERWEVGDQGAERDTERMLDELEDGEVRSGLGGVVHPRPHAATDTRRLWISMPCRTVV